MVAGNRVEASGLLERHVRTPPIVIPGLDPWLSGLTFRLRSVDFSALPTAKYPVAGLDPATHVLFDAKARRMKTWVAGSSPVKGSFAVGRAEKSTLLSRKS